MTTPPNVYSCEALLRHDHLRNLPEQFPYLYQEFASQCSPFRLGRLVHFCPRDLTWSFVLDDDYMWLRRMSLKMSQETEGLSAVSTLGDVGAIYADGYNGMVRCVRIALNGMYQSLVYLVDFGTIIEVSNMAMYRFKADSEFLKKCPLAVRFRSPFVDNVTFTPSLAKEVLKGRGFLCIDQPMRPSAADSQSGSFQLFVSTKHLRDNGHRGEYDTVRLSRCLRRRIPAKRFTSPALTDDEDGDMAVGSESSSSDESERSEGNNANDIEMPQVDEDGPVRPNAQQTNVVANMLIRMANGLRNGGD